MAGITTHVLDTSRGKPAAGVTVTLEIFDGDDWEDVGHGTTDDDGRCRTLTDDYEMRDGIYRLTFAIGEYNPTGFFPEVAITFEVRDTEQHYHVPLLLSPFGYSTYRGS
jgi:5-hydroxyisourate hydrolase